MTLSSVFLAAAVAAAPVCSVQSPAHTVALVELYTSQGCSSCPPADQWLSMLPSRIDAQKAIPIALHVGYWDYIGWKDPFARREFNDRQRVLASLNGNRTVYTPGVFVHGKETPRWSDASGFDARLRAINTQPAAAAIGLETLKLDADRVTVRVSPSLRDGAQKSAAQTFVALLQSGVSTRVSAGENRGEALRNDHIARDWSGPLAVETQTVTLAAPQVEHKQLAVVAFVQDRASGAILQAVRLPLSDCR